MADKIDMPPLIWADQRDGLSGDHLKGGVWTDIQLTESFTPFVHADLVREAMEAGEAVLTYANQTTDFGRLLKVNGEHMDRLEAALAKLKEAGL